MRKLLSLGLAAGMVVATIAVSASPASASHVPRVTTVNYGPFTIPGGSAEMPGMIKNKIMLGVSKPCIGCYITSMEPDLVYTDGSNANVDTGTMLHHTVLSSGWRPDPTCSRNLLGLIGQRFFASGNERTVIEVPSGYGYYVGWFDSWNMIVDLMNRNATEREVYISMKFTWTRSPQTRVTPVWLDIDQCGDSEMDIPAGITDTHWDWQVNVPGEVVAIGGHVHERGVRIEAENVSTGESICDSVTAYGETPEYIDPSGMPHVSSMTRCIADPVATVTTGQVVRIHAIYDSDEPVEDGMGIMIAFIA